MKKILLFKKYVFYDFMVFFEILWMQESHADTKYKFLLCKDGRYVHARPWRVVICPGRVVVLEILTLTRLIGSEIFY